MRETPIPSEELTAFISHTNPKSMKFGFLVYINRVDDGARVLERGFKTHEQAEKFASDYADTIAEGTL